MVSPGNRHCVNCIGTLSFSVWTIDAECDLFRHQQWINISSGIYVEKCQLSFRHYRYNISTIGKTARLFTVWVIWAGIYKAGTLPTCYLLQENSLSLIVSDLPTNYRAYFKNSYLLFLTAAYSVNDVFYCLSRRRPVRSCSPGAVATIALWKSAPTSVTNIWTHTYADIST